MLKTLLIRRTTLFKAWSFAEINGCNPATLRHIESRYREIDAAIQSLTHRK